MSELGHKLMRQRGKQQRAILAKRRLPSEHELQTQILDWLKQKHIFHFRNNSGAMKSTYKGKTRFMRFGSVGSPDIFAIKDGKIHGIEVKGPHGEWSEAQQSFYHAMLDAGANYILAYSLEDVTKVLDDGPTASARRRDERR